METNQQQTPPNLDSRPNRGANTPPYVGGYGQNSPWQTPPSNQKTIVLAFTFILLGLVITTYPDKSISINIAKLIAWILILVGQIRLTKLFTDEAKTGAYLFLASSVIAILGKLKALVSAPLGFASSVSKFTARGSSEMSFDDLYTASGAEWLMLLQAGLAVGAVILWMQYQPFDHIKTGLQILAAAYGIHVVAYGVSALAISIPGISIFIGLGNLLVIIGFYQIISKLSSTISGGHKIIPLVLMGIGMLYSYLMLADSSIIISVFVIAGGIVWLLGNNKIRQMGDKVGTGAFLAFGILIIIAALFMTLPLVGGVFATVVQSVSYLILGIGFLKFGKNQIFAPNIAKGTTILGAIALINILLCWLPTALGVTALIFCLVELPLIIYAISQLIQSIPETESDFGVHNAPISRQQQNVQQPPVAPPYYGNEGRQSTPYQPNDNPMQPISHEPNRMQEPDMFDATSTQIAEERDISSPTPPIKEMPSARNTNDGPQISFQSKADNAENPSSRLDTTPSENYRPKEEYKPQGGANLPRTKYASQKPNAGGDNKQTIYIILGIIVVAMLAAGAYVWTSNSNNLDTIYEQQESTSAIVESTPGSTSRGKTNQPQVSSKETTPNKPSANAVTTSSSAMYTFSEITNIRSSRNVSSTHNITDKLDYGTRLTHIDTSDEWTEIKYGNRTGYVAAYYILPENKYMLLNSIFTNKNARISVETAESKRALVDYYITNQLYGDPSGGVPSEYSNHTSNWVIYAKHPTQKPNSVYYARLRDRSSEYPDFAVILTNTKTDENKLLIFSFLNNSGKSSLIHEESAPTNKNIHSISYNNGRINVSYR